MLFSPGYIPPRIQAPPSGKSSLQPGAEHMLLPSGMPQTEQPKRRLVGTRAQHCQRLQPLKSSVLANRHHLVSDSGLFMSRSFRVGWGPNWTLVHAGKPVLSQATGQCDTQVSCNYRCTGGGGSDSFTGVRRY